MGAKQGSSTLRVFLSQGDAFDDGSDYAVLVALTVGDFDGPNGLDIAVDGLDEDAYGILLNHGDGTFAAQVSQNLGFFVNGLAALAAAGAALANLLSPLDPPKEPGRTSVDRDTPSAW